MLRKHPNVYAFVDALKKEQADVDSKIIKIKTGIKSKRKSKDVAFDERIRTMVDSYDTNKSIKFLDNLILIL